MKIINIIHFPIAYHMLENVKPVVKWKTGNGRWCGLWRGNWSQRLGDAILNTGKKIDYEVWRPDLRADKVYSHVFENGLIYKLFPSYSAKRFDLLKIREQLLSPALIKGLKEVTDGGDVIIHLNSSPLISINYKIVKTFFYVPIVVTFHGNQRIWGSKIPIYSYLKQQYIRAKWGTINNNIDYITYQNRGQKRMLENVGINKPRGLETMGCDFDYWTPPDNVPSDDKLKFLMACRFVPLKQIDKIIRIFLDLNDKYDFILTIAGTGEREYTAYLEKLASPLTKRNKVRFTGYLLGNELLKEYRKHDYFIMASTSEGCPVSVMEALACKLKVFTTRVGCTTDLLEKYNAGVIVSPYNYDEWKLNLIRILDGEHVKVLDREIARQWFDWPNIAVKFLDIYRKVAELYAITLRY
ncbi:MAG: glycosyltransferase [Candidatus Aminicenantes bacterium]|nr:glycosyltransferase [Candidatus Aminicenantes bacterium]